MLFFMMCVCDNSVLEENTPIIPQITTIRYRDYCINFYFILIFILFILKFYFLFFSAERQVSVDSVIKSSAGRSGVVGGVGGVARSSVQLVTDTSLTAKPHILTRLMSHPAKTERMKQNKQTEVCCIVNYYYYYYYYYCLFVCCCCYLPTAC